MSKKPTREIDFNLSPNLDLDHLAQRFKAAGRIHVPNAFAIKGIRTLADSTSKGIPWKLHFNSEQGVYDLKLQDFAELDSARRQALMSAIHHNAVRNFQFLFENFSVSDAWQQGLYKDHYVMKVFEFLNSEVFLQLGRHLTGNSAICNVNAQLTCYRAGHFLSCHDDEVAGSQRVAAYVIGLTENWRTDWGGLLNFIDKKGHVIEGILPTFNSLNVFRVPQNHSVSCVAPFPPAGRVSLSGWFRC